MPDLAREAFLLATNLWSEKGMTKVRLLNPDNNQPLKKPYWIGYFEHGAFYAVGDGKTWKDAIEDVKKQGVSFEVKFVIPLYT